jgi:tetratricopeptide (TPR) repeat protein
MDELLEPDLEYWKTLDTSGWEDMPIFKSTITDEDVQNNPDLQALQSLLYDPEATPAETCEQFKRRGNEVMQQALKLPAERAEKRDELLNHAAVFYSQGLDVPGLSDSALKVACLANRAQAQLLLSRPTYALQDAQAALDIDPAHIKALYRAGRATLMLQRYDEAVAFLMQALRLDKGSSSLQAGLREALDGRKRKQAVVAFRRGVDRIATECAGALAARGVTLGLPLFDVPDSSRYAPIAGVDAGGLLSISALFVYPEAEQTDFVAAWREDVPVRDMVASVLAEPAPWDPEHRYRPEKVMLVFQRRWSHLRPDSPTAAEDAMLIVPRPTAAASHDAAPQWAQVKPRLTLRELLGNKKYITPGIPVLYVIPRSGPFTKAFLAETSL